MKVRYVQAYDLNESELDELFLSDNQLQDTPTQDRWVEVYDENGDLLLTTEG